MPVEGLSYAKASSLSLNGIGRGTVKMRDVFLKNKRLIFYAAGNPSGAAYGRCANILFCYMVFLFRVGVVTKRLLIIKTEDL